MRVFVPPRRMGEIQIERYKINWLWGLMTAGVSVPGCSATL